MRTIARSRWLNWCLPWLLVVLQAGCAVAPKHAALQGDTLPPLIPARDFFANKRSAGDYQLSPDGGQLGWIGVYGTGPALFVRPVDADGQPTGVDRVVALGLGGFRWAQDSRHVLFSRDQGGNENYHLMALDTLASEPRARDLTPFPGVAVHLHQMLEDDPKHVLVLHNRRDRRLFDLYRLHIETGKETLVQRNPGDALGVVTDRAGQVVGVVRKQGEVVSLHASFTDIAEAREVLRWHTDDLVTVVGPDAQRRGFYLVTNQGRERRALVHLDVGTGQQRVIQDDPDVDIDWVWLLPQTREPLAALSHPGHQRIYPLDAEWARDLDRFFPERPRRLGLLSISQDGRLLTVLADTDTERRYLLLDRRTGRTTELGQGTANAYPGQLGVTRPVQFTARDGLPLYGYLTLPPGHERRPPGPMVLHVHGGPWARDYWDNGLGSTQFLANRGYAVLQVNYRGSTGYGRRHQLAAIGEFAGKMHDDLLDAVDWAVAQGVADPQRVAIMGASYGGYATLVGLTFTPERFACGVDTVGVSDLVSLVENVPPYWEPNMQIWHRYVGNPAVPSEREVMKAKSPVHRTAAITKPLLVIQTTNDVRVRQDQSDMVVNAMQAREQPVDYLLLSGAGHLSRSWSWGQRLRAERRVEDFLGACLGGRSGGFDYFELAAWAF
ncbi:prolyl oligopeptidase family serine peptidase [Sphaerotilus sp.]|uniref:S9 family peptidase n=1 Tax=Sphaerotilus sp. TaxID=2093942 RepID=UPI00286E362D|nr:prolyl oligopeptidase family serine peptidase [Sphaerotilus sp.]